MSTAQMQPVTWNSEAWFETGFWQDQHGVKIKLPRFFHAIYQDQPIVVGVNIAYVGAGHGEPAYVSHMPFYLDATTLKELELKGVRNPTIAVPLALINSKDQQQS